jgi:hypothetical protein
MPLSRRAVSIIRNAVGKRVHIYLAPCAIRLSLYRRGDGWYRTREHLILQNIRCVIINRLQPRGEASHTKMCASRTDTTMASEYLPRITDAIKYIRLINNPGNIF